MIAARFGRFFALVASLSACATTTGVQERGLADLRVHLHTNVPVGEVVGDRLVHAASGLTLARLPAGPWTASDLKGVPVLFEGAPGVALVVDALDLSLARVRDGALERVRLAPAEYPTAWVVTAADYSIFDGVPAPEVMDEVLDVPMRGVSAAFSAMALTVRSADGAVLFQSDPVAVGVRACVGKFGASLKRAVLPDGGVLLRFEQDAHYRIAEGACTAEIQAQDLDDSFTEGSQRREQGAVVWLLFPASGAAPRVVQSETVVGEDFGTLTTTRIVIDISGGHLVVEHTLDDTVMRTDRSWSWNIVADDGTTYELATGY